MAEVVLGDLLRELRGALGGVVFRQARSGLQVYAMPRRSARAATDEQLVNRAMFARAARGWRELSDAERAGWSDYAAKCVGPAPSPVARGRTGYLVFVKAYWYSLLWGGGVPSVPTSPPPGAITGIVAENSSAEDEVVLRLSHGNASGLGLRVFVEMTPGMVSPARHPQVPEFRAVRGLTADSIPALTASGGVYVFSGARFAVGAGVNFGVAARIVDGCGVASGVMRVRVRRGVG